MSQVAIKVKELTFLSGAPPKFGKHRAGMHVMGRKSAEGEGYDIDYVPGERKYLLRQYNRLNKLTGTFQVGCGPSVLAELQPAEAVPNEVEPETTTATTTEDETPAPVQYRGIKP